MFVPDIKNPAIFILFISLFYGCFNNNNQQLTNKSERKTEYALSDYAKLGKLHTKPAKPKPGEWLYHHKEKGQSFSKYLNRNPVCPTDSINKIGILPIGRFNDIEKKLLNNTADYVSNFFMLEVELFDPISDNIIPAKSKRIHYGTEQLHTKFILDSIMLPNIPANTICFISITNNDLYPADDWNYVFGQAYLTKRAGVSSFYRYFENELDSSNYSSCYKRTIKTTTHELCHMFSIKHCRIYKCLLNGSNHMEEADSRPLWLCMECLAKLQWCIKFDLIKRYDSLISIFERHQLENEKRYYMESRRIMSSPNK